MTRTENIRRQQLAEPEYRKRESDERCGCDSERHEQRDAMESDAGDYGINPTTTNTGNFSSDRNR